MQGQLNKEWKPVRPWNLMCPQNKIINSNLPASTHLVFYIVAQSFNVPQSCSAAGSATDLRSLSLDFATILWSYLMKIAVCHGTSYECLFSSCISWITVYNIVLSNMRTSANFFDCDTVLYVGVRIRTTCMCIAHVHVDTRYRYGILDLYNHVDEANKLQLSS